MGVRGADGEGGGERTWHLQNNCGEGKNGRGNRAAEERVCRTHRHGLGCGDSLREWGATGGAQRGTRIVA